MRSCKPDPLAADIVHVGEDRGNGACLAGPCGFPGGRVKMFDKNLVHAITGGKDLDRCSAELSGDLVLARDHGSYSVTHDTRGLSASIRMLLFSGQRR